MSTFDNTQNGDIVVEGQGVSAFTPAGPPFALTALLLAGIGIYGVMS